MLPTYPQSFKTAFENSEAESPNLIYCNTHFEPILPFPISFSFYNRCPTTKALNRE